MKNKSLQSILKEIYLFSGMNDEELKNLTAICSIHYYTKDSYLFMKGDRSKYLLILTEGLVSVFKHDNKGNEVTIGLFSPFSLLAEPATLKEIPLPSSAMFKSNGSVIKIELDSFKRNFFHDPHISSEIIKSLLDKIQLLQNNIHLNIASSAKEKVLHFYQKNNSFSAELKKYEIASLLGMTAETFSRNLNQLIKEKKLTQSEAGYKTV